MITVEHKSWDFSGTFSYPMCFPTRWQTPLRYSERCFLQLTVLDLPKPVYLPRPGQGSVSLEERVTFMFVLPEGEHLFRGSVFLYSLWLEGAPF